MKTDLLAAETTEVAFFREIASNLAFIVKKDHVLVTQAVDGSVADFIDSVVFWSKGEFVANVRYALAGTPCKVILDGRPYCYPRQVQRKFPHDRDLKELGAESYLGCPILSSSGGVLGHVAVLDSKPIKKPRELMTIVRAFASLAASEFDRVRIIGQLKRSEERYRALYDSTPTMFFTVHRADTLTSMNAYGLAKLGYRADELIGRSVLATVLPEDADAYRSWIERCFALEDEVHDWEIRKVRKSGSILWCREWARMIDDADGRKSLLLVSEDITESRKVSQQLSYHASHDSMTGLFNRRQFEIILEALLLKGRAESREHVLCYLDLDRFKMVNDSCGHPAGDELLRQLSALLQSSLRKTDTLARLGGDEFAVIMEDCSIGTAQQVAQTLRTLVDDHEFRWAGRRFSIGVSIGLVPIDRETRDLAELMRAADAACYAAKNAGRNTIRVVQAAAGSSAAPVLQESIRQGDG